MDKVTKDTTDTAKIKSLFLTIAECKEAERKLRELKANGPTH